MNVVNLSSDRGHEFLCFLKMGYSLEEIAEFFDTPKKIVEKILIKEFDKEPTPPSAA